MPTMLIDEAEASLRDHLGNVGLRPGEDAAATVLAAMMDWYETERASDAAPLDEDGRCLAEYAHKRRVVPVSPNTLHAYLTVVRMGLRGFQLQESAREILQHLSQLGSDVEALRSELDTALKQARHSLANLSDADAALARVEGRLGSVTSGAVPEDRR